jgi:hypothetical protein
MSPEKQNPATENAETVDHTDRRKALLNVGKLAVYAAPFTIMALTNKAEAATGHGPGKH